MDNDTQIITKGVNGQIPVDAYSDIVQIKDEETLDKYKATLSNRAELTVFDINIHSNFGSTKLTDLGGGLMKVMIPLGNYSKDTVNVHYFDNNGARHDLEFTFETYNGIEYVCFITDHFSVYGISGIETSFIADNDVVDSVVPTGDEFALDFYACIAGLALVIMAATVFIRRKAVR
jgi:hypothetical protein